jgi:hypothetical protein
LVFIALAVTTGIFAFLKKFSVIPVLGALSCAYLMIEIPPVSWLWFFAWMGLGLLLYAFYGYRKSKLSPSVT